jgi:two-component system NarL family response regulator
MSQMIRVLLADDHPFIREGLAAVIALQDDMEVVGEANNGQEALELYRQLKPNVMLTDLQMPILNGVELTKLIRADFPRARIIVLTAHDGDEDIYRSLQAGAAGYLLKDSSRKTVVDGIRTVHNGKELISPEVAAKLAQRIRRIDLTARELEVLNEIAAGKSNQEIGAALFISEGTVKAHVNNLLSKLGVNDRTQAVVCAVQRGIVHLD